MHHTFQKSRNRVTGMSEANSNIKQRTHTFQNSRNIVTNPQRKPQYNMDKNPYRQESYNHQNSYASRIPQLPTQQNPPWKQQFPKEQYNTYAQYQHKNPQEYKKDTINNRMNSHIKQDGSIRKDPGFQYVPRLQSSNNEMFERNIHNPTYDIQRNNTHTHILNIMQISKV